MISNNPTEEHPLLSVVTIGTDLQSDTFNQPPLVDGAREDQVLPQSSILTATQNEEKVKRLLEILRNGSEDEFLQQYEICAMMLSNENHISLLIEATAQNRKTEAFDAILPKVIEINGIIKDPDEYIPRSINIEESKISVFEVAMAKGNSRALEEILKYKKFPLLTQTVELVGRMLELKTDNDNLFWKCFDMLLEKINSDDVRDMGCKLLDYALLFGNKKAIEKLLKAGTYIGSEDKAINCFTIDLIDLKLLTELFDSCIAKCGSISKNAFKIDYSNLRPPKKVTGSENIFKEMTLIKRIASSKEKQDLLKHPLITSFMTLKWHRISWFFYANVILYCFYGISMIAYIIFNCIGYGPDHCIVRLFWWCTIFGIIFLILRELTQMLSPKKYFKKLINFFEIALIISSVFTIKTDFQKVEKVFVAVTVLLMVVDLCMLLRSLQIPHISTHMLMLEEVLKSFLWSSLFYSIFIFAFSLCFYILIGYENLSDNNNIQNGTDERNISNVNDTNIRNGTDENDKKDKTSDMFPNILKSIVKVMAMFVGELDYSSLGLSNIYCYALFLLFIVSMTVVLMNLLIGLAVEDTQTIRDRAEINKWICWANVLNTFEDYHIPFEKMREDYARLIFCLSCSCNTKIHLLPNPPNHYLDDTKYCGECKKSMNKMCSWLPKMLRPSPRQTMPSGVMTSIKNSTKILGLKKKTQTQQQNEEERKDNQLRKIEANVEDIFTILKELRNIPKEVETIFTILKTYSHSKEDIR